MKCWFPCRSTTVLLLDLARGLSSRSSPTLEFQPWCKNKPQRDRKTSVTLPRLSRDCEIITKDSIGEFSRAREKYLQRNFILREIFGTEFITFWIITRVSSYSISARDRKVAKSHQNACEEVQGH